MNYLVTSSLSYSVISQSTFFFNIMALKSENQTILEESLTITPTLAFEEFSIKNSSTRLIKLEVQSDSSFTINYRAKVAVEFKKIKLNELLGKVPFIKMDHEVLPYISPSRHCESDKLMEFAKYKFENLSNDYLKVLAIEDWIFNNIKYTAGSTNSSASATDTIMRGVGVCKDFSHLGIALCRALDIPARYFTAYASDLTPPDFHACFEANINGHWIIFDPTRLAGLNGMVKISNGKDASEAPIATFYGEILCTHMDVQCHPDSSDFKTFDWENRSENAIAY